MLAAIAATAAPPDAGTVVSEAVRVLAAERHGVTAFLYRYSYHEYGPAHNKTLIENSMRLRNDGALVSVHLLNRSSNGAAASRQEIAKLQADLDKHLPQDDYRLPLTRDALSEYRFSYAQTPCASCSPGSVVVSFVSRVRDDGHGDGTVAIDPSTGHFLRLEFHPSALPAHADSGAIVVRFDRALPDLWDIVEVTQHYTGHMLFVHGGADVDQVCSAYQRFATLTEGLAALASADTALKKR